MNWFSYSMFRFHKCHRWFPVIHRFYIRWMHIRRWWSINHQLTCRSCNDRLWTWENRTAKSMLLVNEKFLFFWIRIKKVKQWYFRCYRSNISSSNVRRSQQLRASIVYKRTPIVRSIVFRIEISRFSFDLVNLVNHRTVQLSVILSHHHRRQMVLRLRMEHRPVQVIQYQH